MKKKLVTMMLATTMVASVLAGCGGGGDDGGDAATDDTQQEETSGDAATDEGDTAEGDTAEGDTAEGDTAEGDTAGGDAAEGSGADLSSDPGQVINIYSFNDEVRNRINAVYPEITEAGESQSKLADGRVINWIINPNEDGVYQDKLDQALSNQATAADDDKVDIFAAELDYITKYSDADVDVAMPLTDLGIDPDTDLADQFSFTKVVASDQNGVQRGSTWQACPGVLVYRRDIAKEVFGTDDPTEVGKKTSDWATMKETAEELKAKGYYVFSNYDDTFRLYSNAAAQPWVSAGETKVVVDQKIMDWANDSKEWLDAGYFDPAVSGQWNSDWYTAMTSSSKVFAFLFPAWGIDTQLVPNWDGDAGSWAVTNAPEAFNWGGTFLLGATGTDNPAYVKDIILCLTGNADSATKISQEYSDFTNNMTVMTNAASDDSFASDFLGGQNPYEYFTPAANNVQMALLSAYDQGCVEEMQNAMHDYFKDVVTLDEAKENFENAIKTRYPDITEVVWPQ